MIKLGKLKLSSSPSTPQPRYWYHPESESYFIEVDESIAMSDGMAVEITKDEYDARTADQQSAVVASSEQADNVDDSARSEAVGVSEQADIPSAPASKPAGIRLGRLSVGGVPASADSGNAVVAPVAESTDAVVIEHPPGSPEGFKMMLDKFDSLVVASGGVTPLTLDTARAYVRDIFIELQRFPELDPIFVDRDMHNMMAFMQRTTIQARAVITEKKAKAETRANKKINTSFGDFGSFGDPAKPVSHQLASETAVQNALAAFGGLDVAGVDPKLKR